MKKIPILLALVFLMTACSGDKDQTTKQTNNEKQAPTFDLVDVDGNPHNLSDYAGKKVYIKFWASWCSICLSGLEEINTLAAEEKDFVVLTIVSPGFNNEKNSDAFIKWFKGVENVSSIPVLLDEGGSIAKHYQVRGYPTSVFINADGELIKTQPGHLSNEQIRTQLK
ncbi:redoxin family protein [Sporosarcina sp. E16_3]|nr:redoxin family protein [Sporosarcina sp. E16_3]